MPRVTHARKAPVATTASTDPARNSRFWPPKATTEAPGGFTTLLSARMRQTCRTKGSAGTPWVPITHPPGRRLSTIRLPLPSQMSTCGLRPLLGVTPATERRRSVIVRYQGTRGWVPRRRIRSAYRPPPTRHLRVTRFGGHERLAPPIRAAPAVSRDYRPTVANEPSNRD